MNPPPQIDVPLKLDPVPIERDRKNIHLAARVIARRLRHLAIGGTQLSLVAIGRETLPTIADSVQKVGRGRGSK